MRGHFPRRCAGRSEKRKQGSCCTSAHYNGVKHHWLVCRENTKKMFQSVCVTLCVICWKSRLNECTALHRYCVRLTSSTWACVCCSLRLLEVLGGPEGAAGAPSAPGAPGAPGAAAGAASGADLRARNRGWWGVDGSNDITLTTQQFHVCSDAIVRGVGEMCRSGRMSECVNYSGELILQINGVGF